MLKIFMAIAIIAFSLTSASASNDAESLVEQILRKISSGPDPEVEFLYRSTGQRAECCPFEFGAAAIQIPEETGTTAIAIINVKRGRPLKEHDRVWVKAFPGLSEVEREKLLGKLVPVFERAEKETLDFLPIPLVGNMMILLPVKEFSIVDERGDGSIDLFTESFYRPLLGKGGDGSIDFFAEFRQGENEKVNTTCRGEHNEQEERIREVYKAVINALGVEIPTTSPTN